jgi:diguanylate cyclase (GGDEF)-like protein
MQGEILRYSFRLATPETMLHEYRKDLTRDMSFFGVLLTLAVIALVIYMATGFTAYLSFAVFSLAMWCWFFRVFGYGFEWFWPNYPQLNDLTYGITVYALMLSALWLPIEVLRRQGKQVKLERWMWRYGACLVLAGALSAFTMPLQFTLNLPLLWFFPFIVLLMIVLYLEHKAGSGKARWFAFSMLPMWLSAAIVILTGLGMEIPIDLVMSIMAGVTLTNLMLAIMISAYLVRLLQNQRDHEQQLAHERALQAEILERQVQERTEQLQESNRKLQALASIDPLTDLPNRRTLDRFVDQSQEHGFKQLGIAVVDLDHFKSINDTYGHDVGDLVLKSVARVLEKVASEQCIGGRFGGEEFAVVMCQPKRQDFEHCLEQIHRDIKQIRFPEHPNLQVTASIGWVLTSQEEVISESFRRADKALYVAKECGRDRMINGNVRAVS